MSTDPGLCSAVVTYPLAVAEDHCGLADIACEPPSGSVFPKGTTVVICTATCIFTVIVNDAEDPTVLAAPINNPSGGGAPNPSAGFYQLTGTDNCSMVAINIKDTASGTVFGPFASGTKVKLTHTIYRR